MDLNSVPEQSNIEETVEYLMRKGVKVNDIKLFVEFANIERYVAKMSHDPQFRCSAVH